MRIETPRLIITDFTPAMARAVHLGSLDADTQHFLPDEVFPTEEIAAEVIADLISCYAGNEGPYVHPMLLKSGEYAGYVQLVPLDDGTWEVGYHTVAAHTGKGYATEALTAFMQESISSRGLKAVYGVCHADNAASLRVLEKCGFQTIFRGQASYQGQLQDVVKMIYPPEA